MFDVAERIFFACLFFHVVLVIRFNTFGISVERVLHVCVCVR